jgi:hypothetical protein
MTMINYYKYLYIDVYIIQLYVYQNSCRILTNCKSIFAVLLHRLCSLCILKIYNYKHMDK